MLAMLQPVDDIDHVVNSIVDRGWPLRWQPSDGGWQSIEKNRALATDGSSAGEAWMHYHHYVPSPMQWDLLNHNLPLMGAEAPVPRYIRDFVAYNAGSPSLPVFDEALAYGKNWVGDLALECTLEVNSPSGDVILELIKGGRRFTCRIDVATGRVVLGINEQADFHPAASTAIRGRGAYRVMFSNIDQELRFWIDRKLVRFDAPTTYPDLDNHVQQDADLAPAGIGSRGAALTARHVPLWRNVYYTSFTSERPPEFPLKEDQFFMLGDNSPSSKDGRLWPGDWLYPEAQSRRDLWNRGDLRVEYYVRRDLLIGKALFIYWPHSWPITVFGQTLPFPLAWPNFHRMHFVR